MYTECWLCTCAQAAEISIACHKEARELGERGVIGGREVRIDHDESRKLITTERGNDSERS